MVMFVFIVIFFLVMIIFYRFTINSIKEEERNYKLERFNLMIEIIPNMPEFKCSELGKEIDCVDVLKLLGFKNLNNEYYNEMFKDKTIYFEEIYPEENGQECVSNYFNCGKFIIADNAEAGLRVSGPVVLYYANEDEYKIGKVVIQEEK